MTSPQHSPLHKALAAAGSFSLIAASFAAVPAAFAAETPATGYSVSATQTQGLPGQYQVAYSAKSNKLYVTGSNGRPPVLTGTLARVNPDTLQVEAVLQLPTTDFTPRGATEPTGKQLTTPYGIDVDDASGTIWVTNTRVNSVSVYDQATLKHLWTSSNAELGEANAIAHPREVKVDSANGKVYVSGTKAIWVFDSSSHALLKKIDLTGDGTGTSTMNIAVDSKAGVLYVPQLGSDSLHLIDTKSLEVTKTIALHKDDASVALRPSDVAFDESLNEIYVTAQGTKGANAGVTVYDRSTGEYKRSIAFGTQPLALDNDEARDLLYATDFGAGTVTVIDAKNSQVISTVKSGERGSNDVVALPTGAVSVDKATFAENVEVPFTIDPTTGEFKTSATEAKEIKDKDGNVTSPTSPINANSLTKLTVVPGAANTSTKDIIPSQTVSANQDKGATVTAPTEVVPGETVTFTGAGWTREDGKGVQIQPKVNRKEAAGFDAFTANADGTFSVTYTIPADAAVDSEIAVNFLSGSLQEGDKTRGAGLKLKVVKEHQKETVTEATEVTPSKTEFKGYGTVVDSKVGLPEAPKPQPSETAKPTPTETAKPTPTPSESAKPSPSASASASASASPSTSASPSAEATKPGTYEHSATENVHVYSDGAKLYVPKEWKVGDELTLRGEGFTTQDKLAGSLAALKIKLNGKTFVTPKVAPAAPAGVEPNSGGIYTYIQAEKDGSFTVKIAFPTVANSDLKQEIQDGDKLSFYLLTGSLKDGDVSRGGKAAEYEFVIRDANGNVVKNDGTNVNAKDSSSTEKSSASNGTKASTAATSSSKKLASTGANGVLIAAALGALAVLGGAVLVARRRKA